MIGPGVSAGRMRFLLNLYPPFLFQGIRVRNIEDDFHSATVLVRKTVLTRNVMGTTFGGALMSAADPFYPLLYWRSLVKKGEQLSVWLKTLDSTFLVPATEGVWLKFQLDAGKLEQARKELDQNGRADVADELTACFADGQEVARFRMVSSLRLLDHGSSAKNLISG